MHPAGQSTTASRVWAILALAAAGVWLWISWCRLPASSWNDLRLAAVFMAAHGEPVYSLPGEGVLNTWLYGPAPLWLWSPALLAPDAVSALLVAGGVNLAFHLGALGAVCLCWPAAGATRADRLLALALTCLLWPEPAFRFLQSDNLVVAGGLIANLLLVHPRSRATAAGRWGAALATALALASKQTAVGLVAGQILWLWLAQDGRCAGRHVVRTAFCGAGLAAIAVAQFGARELWFGLVTVPGRLPWADDLAQRTRDTLPWLLLLWGAPAVVLAATRRHWRADSPALGLPIACWLTALPLGLAGLFTVGGSINHLHGYALLTPPALVVLLALARRATSRAVPLAAALTVALVLGKIATTDHVPLWPATERVRAADALVRLTPGELWLPWSPLVTWFAEGRFDHTEDGIYVRFITGHPVSLAHARAHLPPRCRAMLLPPGADWGVAIKLAGQPSTEREIAGWRLVRWAPPSSGR